MYLCVLCLSCQLLFLKDVHLAAFSALYLWHKRGLESWSGKHSISKSFCLPCLMLLPGDKWTNLQFMSRCSVWISIQVFLAGKWQGRAEHSTKWFHDLSVSDLSEKVGLKLYLVFIRRIFSRMLKTSSKCEYTSPCSQTPGRSKWSSQR